MQLISCSALLSHETGWNARDAMGLLVKIFQRPMARCWNHAMSAAPTSLGAKRQNGNLVMTMSISYLYRNPYLYAYISVCMYVQIQILIRHTRGQEPGAERLQQTLPQSQRSFVNDRSWFWNYQVLLLLETA